MGEGNVAWGASGVVAGEEGKVGGGKDATHHRYFVPPHTLRVLQNGKVILQLSVVKHDDYGDEASSHGHSKRECAGLWGILGGVGYVGPRNTAHVMFVVAV